jgi:hypothetical protein
VVSSDEGFKSLASAYQSDPINRVGFMSEWLALVNPEATQTAHC